MPDLDSRLQGSPAAAGEGHRPGVNLQVQDVRRQLGLDRAVGWGGRSGRRGEPSDWRPEMRNGRGRSENREAEGEKD